LDALRSGGFDVLRKNEFYFQDLGEDIVRGISPEQAFEAINELVPFMLAAQESDAYFWCGSLLLSLAHRSKTTEIPSELKEKWLLVMERMADRSDVARQIKEWYRRN
jgi:hypothetical protein